MKTFLTAVPVPVGVANQQTDKSPVAEPRREATPSPVGTGGEARESKSVKRPDALGVTPLIQDSRRRRSNYRYYESRKCDHCGSEYLARRDDVRNGRARFCSKECHASIMKHEGRPDVPRDRKKEVYAIVEKAISSGELLKHPCEECGSEKSEAHHEDYDKPLEVIWLCRSCHTKLHMPSRGGGQDICANCGHSKNIHDTGWDASGCMVEGCSCRSYKKGGDVSCRAESSNELSESTVQSNAAPTVQPAGAALLFVISILIAGNAFATPPNQVPLQVPKRTAVQALVNSIARSLPNAASRYKVHFIYLVPSDRDERATEAIKATALNIQRFYRWQMGNGKTFTLTDPIVSVYKTNHDNHWYAWEPVPNVVDWRQWFWLHSLDDLHTYAGGGFYMEFDDWICYVDADTRAGQAGGGTSGACGDKPCFAGCAVMASTDIAGIMGLDPPGQQCRWFGGGGHEEGHSFGLPHPDIHDPLYLKALMGAAYQFYPSAILTPSDKIWLGVNPFFRYQRAVTWPFGACKFDDARHPLPTPVARPTPASRAALKKP